jgi:glycerol kinase
MSFILALDQGTTSSRTLVFDLGGNLVASAARPYPQHYPRPGWVEHDPADILATQQGTMREALAQAGLTLADVAAVGLTNQRETTLLWSRASGEALHPAIVWQDRRTAPRCAELRAAGRTEWLHERTGLLPDPYFSATKLEWLLDNVPEARRRAEAGELAFGTVDSWLVHHLTAGAAHVTDRTNASRTLLWNLREERWDPDLLALFRVPESLLPRVLPSAAEFGRLPGGPPISGIAGDQQAALFGQAGWEPGLAKNTYGTGCFLLVNTGAAAPPPPPGLLATAACGPHGGVGYAIEGSVFVAGAAIQWLRDELGLIADAAESEALARSVPDSGGVVVVPAFTGLGAPYWDPDARGAIVGLTRGSSRAQVVRATLEAVAQQTADLVEALAEAGAAPRSLRVDGGACENDFLMQFQADVLGIPVERAAFRETTALGAAFLAGLGAGVWRQHDLDGLWRADRVFEPTWSADQRAARRAEWGRAVARVRS